MNRKDQYTTFNKMLVMLINYAELEKIPIRLGEVHRTMEQAKLNLKKGVSKTLKSKHRYSLAVDIWITKPYKGKPGKDIDWFKDKRNDYIKLGKIWKILGGTWGGLKKDGGDFNTLNDPYHFEIRGAIL